MPRGLKKDVPKRVKDRSLPVEQITAELACYPLLLKDSDVSAISGISVSTLRKARCDGLIRGANDFPPHTPIGGRVFYKKSSFIKWLASLKESDAS